MDDRVIEQGQLFTDSLVAVLDRTMQVPPELPIAQITSSPELATTFRMISGVLLTKIITEWVDRGDERVLAGASYEFGVAVGYNYAIAQQEALRMKRNGNGYD